MPYPGITAIRDTVGLPKAGKSKVKSALFELTEKGKVIKTGTVEEIASYVGRGENYVYVAASRGSSIAGVYKVKKL